MRASILFASLLSTCTAFGQQPLSVLSQKVQQARDAKAVFRKASLFQAAGSMKSTGQFEDAVASGQLLTLDPQKLKALFDAGHETIEFEIPRQGEKSLTLELVRHELLASGFALVTSESGGAAVAWKPGAYYRGVVAGQTHSFAAVSLFENEVIGVVSTAAEGNMVLGKVEDPAKSASYVFYKEGDLLVEHEFQCGTEDKPSGGSAVPPDPSKSVANCVRAYLECEQDLVTEKGGATGAANYMTGLFNVVAALYQNEQITVQVSQIFTWTTQDPYTASSTSAALNAFKNYRTSYNGDVAHLVSRGAPTGGGVAWLDALCGSYGYAYSFINSSYSQLPTYSWSVEVIAHEMGHNLGSQHTHACAWNSNNTAIDGCGPAAGSSEGCNAALPVKGTIMSYCHLVSGVGIDFNLGFGTQPGDRIRTEITGASCLTTCGSPSCMTVTASGTNPSCPGGSNGTATAATNSTSPPFTYAWSNGGNTQAIGNLGTGTYTVTVTDATGCTGTASKSVTAPTAFVLTTSVTNASAAGASNGSINLSVSGGTAPYAYSWSNGATTQDISSLTAGTYTVTVTAAGNCTATKSATVANGGGGNCPATVAAFPYSESFEAGLGLWTQNTDDDFDWTRNSGHTPTVGSGPAAAISGSHYLYLEATGNSPNKTGRLTGPCFNFSNLANPKLNFYFSMYGSTMGTLRVEASVGGGAFSTIWSVSGNQGTYWYSTNVSLAAYQGGTVRLRFSGTTGSGEWSDIAIDGVSVTGTSTGSTCSPTAALPHLLSFESGLNGWQQPATDGMDWTVKSGTTPTTATGPSYAYQGTWYAYTEATGNSAKKAELLSPCFNLAAVANPALSFAYHMYGAQTGSLNLEISTNAGTSWTSIWLKSGDQGSGWKTASVPLAAYAAATVKFRFTGTVGGNTSDMAVDAFTVTGTNLTSDPDISGLTAGNGSGLSLSPNPASSELTVRFFSETEGEGQLLVTDQLGRVAKKLQVRMVEGENEIRLEVGELSPGLHFLALAGAQREHRTEKFLVEK